MVNDWLQRIQSWGLPRSCVRCLAPLSGKGYFCTGCRQSLPWLATACVKCAAPLPAVAVCGECQRRPPAFGSTLAPLRYAPPIDRLIWDLKYHARLEPARILGELLADHAAHLPRPDVILPIPLHKTRLRERGYNQALELARVTARRLGVPLDTASLVRTRATPSQTQLPPASRRGNVRNAFATPRALTGLSVALIDDVMTTGATAEAAARCLRRAGAASVTVWVVARA